MSRFVASLGVLLAFVGLLTSSEGVAAQGLLPIVPTVVSGVVQPLPTVVSGVSQPVATTVRQVSQPVATVVPRAVAPVATAVQQVSAPLTSGAGTSSSSSASGASGGGGGSQPSSPSNVPASSVSSVSAVTSAVADTVRDLPVVGPATAPVVDAVVETASSVVDTTTGAAQQTLSAVVEPLQTVLAPPGGATDAVPPASTEVAPTTAPLPAAPASDESGGGAPSVTAGQPEVGSSTGIPTLADESQHGVLVVPRESGGRRPSPWDEASPQEHAPEPQAERQPGQELAPSANTTGGGGTNGSSVDLPLRLATSADSDNSTADVGQDEEEEVADATTPGEASADSVHLAALTGADLAYLLEQCGPHPAPGTPGCEPLLGPPGPPPTVPDRPVVETAGAQFASEPVMPETPVQAAASAVTRLVTSGLARTGGPDLSVVVLLLAVLFVAGIALRRFGRAAPHTTSGPSTAPGTTPRVG